jgi:hypothetical protein
VQIVLLYLREERRTFGSPHPVLSPSRNPPTKRMENKRAPAAGGGAMCGLAMQASTGLESGLAKSAIILRVGLG